MIAFSWHGAASCMPAAVSQPSDASQHSKQVNRQPACRTPLVMTYCTSTNAQTHTHTPSTRARMLRPHAQTSSALLSVKVTSYA